MPNTSVYVKRLQFYADLQDVYTNRLFTFAVNDIRDCFRLMLKFAIAGNVFRKAWFNTLLPSVSVKNFSVSYRRIKSEPLQAFVDYFNECVYDRPPTLEQAINDYRMYSGQI